MSAGITKRLLALVMYALFFLLFVGCQRPAGTTGMDVIIKGQEKFPSWLVGRWKEDEDGWEFVFESNGELSSIVHTLGRVRMEPGKVTRVPMKKGGKSIFEPGQWSVYLDADSGKITISIVLEHFYAELGDGTIEGDSRNVFTGQIPPPGSQSWVLEWTCFRNCRAHTKEYPNFDLSTDPVYGAPDTLVFQKVEKQN